MLVVGGIIVHDEDAWHLQQRLGSFLFGKLRRLGHDRTKFELHATELRDGTKQWASLDRSGQQQRGLIIHDCSGVEGTLQS